MKKITVKLALFFIVLIIISSSFSFLISTNFTQNIEKEIKLGEKSIASSILELRRKTDLSMEEIVDIISTPIYDVKIVKEEALKDLEDEDIETINKDGLVLFYHKKFSRPTIIFELDNTFFEISLHQNETLFKIVISRIWRTVVSYVSIGILLIILLARSVVKPILRLNTATKEVAKGNFDIQVKTKSKDEIGQLTENFNKMTRELKNIDYLRKDFISNVSHEFKTPIASIQGFAKLLQSTDLSEEERKEYTSIIVEETNRLSNLSANMLKLSKLENQEILEEGNMFSLDEQIRKSILLLVYEWNKKNIEFDLELERIDYHANEDLLQQVWINLISNAIRYSKPDSKIKITLQETESNIEVKIKDNGIGISEEAMDRIFEKFYQEDESHNNTGNGLGLPLVKTILDLYNANISVESKINEGSTFIIELPLQRE